MGRLSDAAKRFAEVFDNQMFARTVQMSERNYEITRAHLVDGATLDDLAKREDPPISKQRVGQIIEQTMLYAERMKAQAERLATKNE